MAVDERERGMVRAVVGTVAVGVLWAFMTAELARRQVRRWWDG